MRLGDLEKGPVHRSQHRQAAGPVEQGLKPPAVLVRFAPGRYLGPSGHGKRMGEDG